MKKRYFGRDSIEFILKHRHTMTRAELAKSLCMREETLSHLWMNFHMERGLEVPHLMLKREVCVAKILKRHDAEQQIRVSTIRLKQAGLGDVMRFKSWADPGRRVVVIAAEEALSATTLEDALVELFGGLPRPKKKTKTSDGDGAEKNPE